MGFEIQEELHVEVKHQPGALAGVLKAVADAGVAVRAFCAYGGQGSGHVMLVPANAAKAKAALKKAGYDVDSTKVVVGQVKDARGAGAKLAAQAAKKKINLDYVYASGNGKGQGTIVLAAGKSPAKLKSALK